MSQDWTPTLSDTCNGWSSDSDALEYRVGEKRSLDSFLDDGERSCALASGGTVLIGTQPVFYCVEQ